MKYKREELQQAKNFIELNFDRIIEWTIGDIKRCCKMHDDETCEDGGALVGAFILWSCAIDYYGGLYTGFTSPGATESRFEHFITKYMPRYEPKKVCDLRWALLHYYSIRHFALYHQGNIQENRDKHLTITSGGILLHLGCSIRDLEIAVNNYYEDLKKDDNLKIKLWRYYKEQYPLMPITVERLILPKTFSSLATGMSAQTITASGTASPEDWFK